MKQQSLSKVRWWWRLGVAVVIVAWLGVSGLGGPIFGKISEVTSNDQATFLPKSADSTAVSEFRSKLGNDKSIPAIVLFESSEKLTPAQFLKLREVGKELGSVAGIGQVVGPIPSKDGVAAEFIVPISDSSKAREIVPELRAKLAEVKPEGLTSYLTGPAGLADDLVAAFGGIDGILLLVALGAVFVILLVVYRSIVLPLAVLISASFALSGAIFVIYQLALNDVIKLNGQAQGILSILVIGAATDYALLMCARFREALTRYESKWQAIGQAYKAAWEPITASAATVALALLCLLISDLNSNRGLGPVAAIGIGFAWLASMTFLPALLALFGRGAFWPFRPKFEPIRSTEKGLAALRETHGIWHWVGELVARRYRVLWIVSSVFLLAGAWGVSQLKADGVAQTDLILRPAESVAGQKILAKHYEGGSGSPAQIVVRRELAAPVVTAARGVEGVGSVQYLGPAGLAFDDVNRALERDGKVIVTATLVDQADSPAAEDTVRRLRTELAGIDSSVLVGGVTATAIDTNDTARRDLTKIIPVVLVVILIVLILLLRSIVAPILLVGTVVLSYAATLGISALVFDNLFNFPGADATVPLFGFVFLVALGVDYNIFLMTRVREESILHGTRDGILRGLALTGGVITSAGVVLAATFAALGVIPILFLVQLAFIVAFGVLLDTILVRSILVPALSYEIGGTIWWPSKLRHK